MALGGIQTHNLLIVLRALPSLLKVCSLKLESKLLKMLSHGHNAGVQIQLQINFLLKLIFVYSNIKKKSFYVCGLLSETFGRVLR